MRSVVRERAFGLRYCGKQIMALTKCSECATEISTKAEKCPKCGAKAKKKTSVFTWIIAIIVVLGVVRYLTGNQAGSAGSAGTTSTQKPSTEDVIQSVKLDFSWKKAGFDSIMKADFTVTNSNTFPIKDIQITCIHSAKSGTVIDKNERTIYDIVPAKGKRTFKDFDMGFIHSQAASSSCQITNLKN
jgi:hypothetical protein